MIGGNERQIFAEGKYENEIFSVPKSLTREINLFNISWRTRRFQIPNTRDF
jgi:hypothetical protein